MVKELFKVFCRVVCLCMLRCTALYLCCGELLYSIAWNNAQKGTISQDDIKKCNYSCLFAWFMGNDMLQKFYHNKAEDYKRMYDEISHS